MKPNTTHNVSEAKHTPGPWSVLGAPIGHGQFIHAADSVHNKIAQDVFNHADARLIAAAPELLADAKANADWFEANGYPTEAANIRKLISRAEGRDK